MTQLETIESVIPRVPCPICLNSRLEVALVCDTPRNPCDYQAVCGHCGYRFMVSSDVKTMEELWPRVESQIIQKGCPQCGDHKLRTEFVCDVKSEDCYFVVRCSDHGHYSQVRGNSIQYLFS
ncbi:MAG: hypothetical protein GWM98_20925 [Nitrospinaceae bacterium]|nr:hypothetical protein [Nitrospinaceae bacterium]NIR53293.1 hypothetical protein [Nitrospinaceae bacterium]NIS83691.1 hypothetical protein [Nitrospinaceae bacterium]NIT83783.1 hypothetical protein [Nitrospinaceae bacterium]NIU45989.1 hypothetical protein [Nitrospinaceae bacterium]